jgi:hypothetical protein
VQHGEQLISRDTVVGSVESVRQALVTHTLQRLNALPAGVLASVSVAQCSLVCMLSGGSFVPVQLVWQLQYKSMKQRRRAPVAQSKCASA